VPIELQLRDGSVIKGATPEEAFENLAKAKRAGEDAACSTASSLSFKQV